MNFEKIILIILLVLFGINLFLHISNYNSQKETKETYEEHSKNVISVINEAHRENIRHLRVMDSLLSIKQDISETKIDTIKKQIKTNKKMIMGLKFEYDSISKDFILPVPEDYKE